MKLQEFPRNTGKARRSMKNLNNFWAVERSLGKYNDFKSGSVGGFKNLDKTSKKVF